MVKLALAVVALVSLAAVQEETMDNPEYKGWANQKVGAWVKLKSETDTGQMKISGTETATLKEVTAEKATVDAVIVMEMMGQKNEVKQTRPVPAKVKKGTDSEGQKIEKTGEGDEELEIAGKKYKCHWMEMKFEGKQGAGTSKIWFTDQIVGGTAKMVVKAEKPMHVTITRTVVEWKAAE